LQAKLRDIELSIRGILRGYGLKVGEVSRGRFEGRIRELIEGHTVLEAVIGAMLQARLALWSEFTRFASSDAAAGSGRSGLPAIDDDPWGWRPGGHHLSLSC